MKKGIAGVIIFWLAMVSFSFFWNLEDEKKENKQLALETARAFFQQVVITRSWNASHGGVYVPITEGLQPNPYLEDPLRDLSTDQGLTLTKINPAYMTRQIADIASEEKGIQFHITSLKPIRPGNEAADWEKKWLLSFEQGAKEQGSFVADGSGSLFRYMAPLYTKESCLKCHAKHGYQVGDVRGGISVVIPYFTEENQDVLIKGYGLIATLGAILIVAGQFGLAIEGPAAMVLLRRHVADHRTLPVIVRSASIPNVSLTNDCAPSAPTSRRANSFRSPCSSSMPMAAYSSSTSIEVTEAGHRNVTFSSCGRVSSMA